MVSYRFAAAAGLMAAGQAAAMSMNASAVSNSTDSTWKIQVFKNSTPAEFTGTLQSAFTEVLTQNSEFEADFPHYKKLLIAMNWLTASQVSAAEEAANITTITKRDVEYANMPVMERSSSDPTTWKIQVFPNNKTETFNGTIIPVFTKVLTMNPIFESDFPSYKKMLIAMGYLTAEEAAACEEAANVTVVSRRHVEDGIPFISGRSTSENTTTWTLPVWKNQATQKFNGTITSAFTSVLTLNNEWEADFPTYKKQMIAMGWLTAAEAAACEEAANITTISRRDSSKNSRRATAAAQVSLEVVTTWSIQVFPHGPVEVFHGTMPEVFYEVLVENPHFESDFPTWKAQVIAMGWMTAAEAAEAEKAAGISEVSLLLN